MLLLLFLVFLVFRDRVSLCRPGCPGTHSVGQAGLELRNPPASASQVLGLKACATTAQLAHSFNPSTWEAEAGRFLKFEASLAYRVSSRTARTIQKSPISKKQTNKKQNKTKQKTRKKRKACATTPWFQTLFLFLFLFFKTGFLCVALAVLELTL